ncbi:hypothetical protein Poly51_50080 [Rubripirellula tenax]|uniref:Filamentous hemagglutinin n=1 Tax=Rubripirellula tenax TaxID=2528015 RepID=A0A5C6EF54_9BACT|nr:hypothetical protein [Rubripirellula tenax]TWU47210.1 hypothetical protein Poly51_50080 [Rubripirellula tenax]
MPVHFTSKRSSTQRRYFASLLAGGLLFAAPTVGVAADFGCGVEETCDAMPMFEATCGCGDDSCDSMNCGRSKGLLSGLKMPRMKMPNMSVPRINMKRTVVYKALDSVAGGIEKVLMLDKCNDGCDVICDDGCDAGMLDEWNGSMSPHINGYAEPMHIQSAPMMPPSPPPMIVHPHTGSPNTGMPHVESPHVESHSHPIQMAPMAAPQTQMRMSQPRIAPRSVPTQSRSVPTQQRMPTQPRVPVPQPLPEANRPAVPAPPIPDDKTDSMFDSLSDPFGDDEVRVRRYQPVRPSSYESDAVESTERPLSRSNQTSSRRVRSSR